jgi:hypothetical protein
MASILKTFFDNVILPTLLAAASVQYPWLGIFLKFPVIGPGIQDLIAWCSNWLIENGAIKLDIGMIDLLSAEAKAEYAPEIAMLQEAQAQPALTPEQEAEYAQKFQNIIKNHPPIFGT